VAWRADVCSIARDHLNRDVRSLRDRREVHHLVLHDRRAANLTVQHVFVEQHPEQRRVGPFQH
jgi:hypothetical protein